MATYLRRAVSKRKRRFQQDGFDLDLSYITDRVVAMGIPAVGGRALYRNPMAQVARFVSTYHRGHGVCRVYNLCGEDMGGYDPGGLGEGVTVVRYMLEDHQAAPLHVIREFCEDASRHLAAHPRNVALVHCKAGKGRTGTLICAYLLHAGICRDASEAMDLYAKQRTHNRKGLTIASQRRYVEYYEQHLRQAGKLPGQPHASALLAASASHTLVAPPSLLPTTAGQQPPPRTNIVGEQPQLEGEEGGAQMKEEEQRGRLEGQEWGRQRQLRPRSLSVCGLPESIAKRLVVVLLERPQGETTARPVCVLQAARPGGKGSGPGLPPPLCVEGKFVTHQFRYEGDDVTSSNNSRYEGGDVTITTAAAAANATDPPQAAEGDGVTSIAAVPVASATGPPQAAAAATAASGGNAAPGGEQAVTNPPQAAAASRGAAPDGEQAVTTTSSSSSSGNSAYGSDAGGASLAGAVCCAEGAASAAGVCHLGWDGVVRGDLKVQVFAGAASGQLLGGDGGGSSGGGSLFHFWLHPQYLGPEKTFSAARWQLDRVKSRVPGNVLVEMSFEETPPPPQTTRRSAPAANSCGASATTKAGDGAQASASNAGSAGFNVSPKTPSNYNDWSQKASCNSEAATAGGGASTGGSLRSSLRSRFSVEAADVASNGICGGSGVCHACAVQDPFLRSVQGGGGSGGGGG